MWLDSSRLVRYPANTRQTTARLDDVVAVVTSSSFGKDVDMSLLVVSSNDDTAVRMVQYV